MKTPKYKTIEKFLNKALEYINEVNDEWEFSQIIRDIVTLYAAIGDYKKAEEVATKYLGDICEKGRNFTFIAFKAAENGDLKIASERATQARSYLIECMDQYTSLHLELLATFLSKIGEFELAHEILDDITEEKELIGALTGIARNYHLWGNTEKAVELLGSAEMRAEMVLEEKEHIMMSIAEAWLDVGVKKRASSILKKFQLKIWKAFMT